LSTIIELRRRFAGITDSAKARECVRTIAEWTPLPVAARPVTRLRPDRWRPGATSNRTPRPSHRPGRAHQPGRQLPRLQPCPTA
jgi:hypothetical protein